MSSVNKVILVGRVGKEPELRYTGSGTPVCSFSVATSERFKDRDGNPQEKTEWHNIVAWRQLAEICAKYLGKGKQVYIEGKLQTRAYEDQSGNKRYTTEIVANEMAMLGSKDDHPKQETRQEPQGNRQEPRQESAPQSGGYYGAPPYNPDDDLPF